MFQQVLSFTLIEIRLNDTDPKEILVIFSASLPMVNIYKFCKKLILIQTPGEPREQHLGDVRPKKFELSPIS